MKTPNNIDALVLGSGNFGTCLAQQLTRNGKKVALWSRNQETADAINQTRKNPKYLENFTLSELVWATTKIEDALACNPQIIVLATPTQSLRDVLGHLRRLALPQVCIVSAAKGIERGSLKLPQEIIGEILGEAMARRAVTLSGPSFAIEVMERQPTAVAVASATHASALLAQSLFHSPEFRVYTSDDPVGLEIAGALKNVIAIATGAARGLGFQYNTAAALITRGLAEITRIGVCLGANPLTFNGLGGVGDLLLTCTSEKSRNFTVGFRLASGEDISTIQNSKLFTAEGVVTSESATELCKKLNVEAPIIEQVYLVTHRNKNVRDALQTLVSREARPELDKHPHRN